MRKLTNTAFILIILCLLFLLMQKSCNTRKAVRGEKVKYSALLDTLHKERLATGSELARIQSIVASRSQALDMLLMQNDSLSNALHYAIKNAGKGAQAVVVVDIKTEYKDTIKTDTIEVPAICKDDTIYQWPVYRSAYHDEWVNYSMIAGKDSSINRFLFYNSFSLAWNKKRFGKAEAVIINNNPHSETIGMKSWTNPFKPNGQFDFGGYGGYEKLGIENVAEAGLYAELKYRLLTAEINAGIRTDKEQVVNPFISGKLKIAIRRYSL